MRNFKRIVTRVCVCMAVLLSIFTLAHAEDSLESIYTDGKVIDVKGNILKIKEIDINSNKEVENEYEITDTTRLKRIDGLSSLKADEVVSVLYKIKDNKRIAIMVSKIVE